MDIATIVGFIAAITCLMVGIGSNLPSMIDPPSMIIVVGGTLAATLIANPLQEVIGLIGVIKCAILVNVPMPTEIIERIVGFAETARREGILSLEAAIEEGDDPFLSTGVRLAVDGTEPGLIMDILETELQFVEERHKQGQEIIANMGNAAPAFGMIGTLIGLVIMLKNM
ncbi:MAG TPA: MotA/TolQ/ExbB proton channel family protein, partial [Candidatus Latescibacteria bacterium]|nr:MotA/TolQ/ExbB proton channel family protein [Candidatus Latescibacterota bacterium]